MVLIFGGEKSELIRRQDDSLRTSDIVDMEQQLFDTRNELVKLRDAFDQTLGVIRKSGSEFTSLVKCFANLGKCAEEFDDQQSRGALEGESPKVNETKGSPFGSLKRIFNYSGERFELLTLEFGELSRNAESGLNDTLEIIGTVDEFVRNKDELVRRLTTNVSPDDEVDGVDPVEAAYLTLLTRFVEDLGLFLEQSGECFERVLGESQGHFQRRIDE